MTKLSTLALGQCMKDLMGIVAKGILTNRDTLNTWTSQSCKHTLWTMRQELFRCLIITIYKDQLTKYKDFHNPWNTTVYRRWKKNRWKDKLIHVAFIIHSWASKPRPVQYRDLKMWAYSMVFYTILKNMFVTSILVKDTRQSPEGKHTTIQIFPPMQQGIASMNLTNTGWRLLGHCFFNWSDWILGLMWYFKTKACLR